MQRRLTMPTIRTIQTLQGCIEISEHPLDREGLRLLSGISYPRVCEVINQWPKYFRIDPLTNAVLVNEILATPEVELMESMLTTRDNTQATPEYDKPKRASNRDIVTALDNIRKVLEANAIRQGMEPIDVIKYDGAAMKKAKEATALATAHKESAYTDRAISDKDWRTLMKIVKANNISWDNVHKDIIDKYDNDLAALVVIYMHLDYWLKTKEGKAALSQVIEEQIKRISKSDIPDK